MGSLAKEENNKILKLEQSVGKLIRTIYFIDERSETERGEVTFLKSHSGRAGVRTPVLGSMHVGILMDIGRP